MKKWIKWVIVIITVFIIGMLIHRNWWPNKQVATALTDVTKNKERKILYWVAPMDPNYRRNKAGKSPMGMDLVAVYADEQSDEKGIIKISPTVENNLGVKIAAIKRMNLSRIIDTVGYVTVNENNIEHIHAYTDGWIKTLNVKTTGAFVQKGQLLLALYSPTLNNAQEELLLALNNNNRSLIRAGEKKLLTLGMSQSQITELKKTKRRIEHVNLYATQGGVVSQLNARVGRFVKPDTDLMTIEDLSSIWIIAEVFERQAGWVKEGQPVLATLPYLPGKSWQGEVDYVYPQLDQQTHTLRVRLMFPNPDLTMKPNMYANVKIVSQTEKNVVAIPRSALIRTGEGDRVILAVGNGRYKAQAVKVGIESGDYYQILAGLNVGDSVVTSAQFLIDSESNLKAAFERMQDQKPLFTPQEYVAMGRVESVNSELRKITLHHEPIELLNMPAMTMELLVDKAVNLNEIKIGDEIQFVLEQQSNGNYRVKKLQVINRPNSSVKQGTHDD